MTDSAAIQEPAFTTRQGEASERPAGIRASTTYSPELESLRGWAILLVFLFHADGTMMFGNHAGEVVSPFAAFMTAGHTGVTLFFVLSAVLLARPFLARAQGGPEVRLGDFYRRRFLRIMPLYSAAVVVSVVLCIGRPGAIVAGLSSLFFLNPITGLALDLQPYSSVWWSLATEAQFYAVLPLIGLALRSSRGRRVGALVFIVWMICYALVIGDREWMATRVGLELGLSILGRAPAFLFGIAAAWILMRFGPRLRISAERSAVFANGGADLLLLAALTGLGLLLAKVSFLGFIKAEVVWGQWHLAEGALWALIVLLVVLAPLRLRPIISNPALASLGLVSYSLYLIHLPILTFGMGALLNAGYPLRTDPALRTIAMAVAMVICLAISAATYRLIERPFLVRKAKIDR